jgi:oligopeptide/dipeptide ABC transporter ATP-binding protein
MSAEPLMEVRDLTIAFDVDGGVLRPADGVGLEVRAGETLGIVGESGSGKSVTLRALIGLLPGAARVERGTISWRGEQLPVRGARAWERLRGSEIAMIFQDPGAGLNPTLSVGAHLTEVLRLKRGLGREAARGEARALLERVGIPEAGRRLRAYPHELSGGMRQRVMIALALASAPRLLLADEPTTALDVTIQDQILTLLHELQQESGMAMVLVSHDIGVVGQVCDRVAVMYAGRLVETGEVGEVLHDARHPYTAGLLASVPTLADAFAGREAVPIAGQLPELTDLPAGCSFRPRCPHAAPRCAEIAMALDEPFAAHGSACPFVHASADAA